MQTTLQKAPAVRTERKRPVATKPALAQLHFSGRREFLALLLSRRREILKAQALAARGYYIQSSDWREWEASDLTSQPNE